jgi:hypothetical protein
MLKYMTENNPKLVDKYIWTRPTPSAHAEDVVVVKTDAGVRAVLDKHTVFPTGYAERLAEVTKRGGVNHDFVRFSFHSALFDVPTRSAGKQDSLARNRQMGDVFRCGDGAID